MQVTKTFWTVIFLLGWLLIPMYSLAFTGLTIQVNGTSYSPLTCSSLPAPYNTAPILSECNGSPRSYGNITIEKHTGSANVAWVDISDAPNADWIYLKNAVIKSTINKSANCNSTGTNYLNCQNIMLSALFSAGPTPASGTNVEFYRSVNWELMRPSTTSGGLGGYFRATGWTEGTQVIAAQQKSITCSNPSATCWAFNWTQGPLTYSYPSLQSDRELKAQTWFGLANKTTDVLRIISFGVFNPPGADKPSSSGDSANDPTIVFDADCSSCCKGKSCDENGQGKGHNQRKDGKKQDMKKPGPKE